MRILGVIILFLFTAALTITGGFALVMWFAGISAAAGLVATGCIMALIVLGSAIAIAYFKPGVDPFEGMEFELGLKHKPDLAVPATEDAAEWTGPITKGGTKTERRLVGLLRSQGRLLTRRASRARHRRAEAGVQVTPPPAPAATEPQEVRLPVPPPVTVTESEPPATITEPEPGSLFSDDTDWFKYRDLANLLEVQS
jgi:hypothetical protein